MAVVLITLAGAIAMWHLVEKRFLFRNSYYIKATNESKRHSNLVLTQRLLNGRPVSSPVSVYC
ncbi:MAG: hypothetical protein LC751_09750 [Actinobacteria bacterium]|nr:hypothetical protein [Actinomycetota bacterium]